MTPTSYPAECERLRAELVHQQWLARGAIDDKHEALERLIEQKKLTVHLAGAAQMARSHLVSNRYPSAVVVEELDKALKAWEAAENAT